jgi:hypothetical protein
VFVFVVHHPLDPHCHANVEGYRALVASPQQVIPVALDRFVVALESRVAGDLMAQPWLDDLRDRYLELALSEPLTRI